MTTPTSPLLPLASTGCGCCAPSAPSATVSAPPPAGASDAMPDRVDVYQVAGMTCGHCTASVTEAVSSLAQVEHVRIDLNAGGVSTVSVAGTVSPETVRTAVEEAGYTVLNS